MTADVPEAHPSRVVTVVDTEADLIYVRQLLRVEALRAGLGLVDQTKLVTAGSELARNILVYATGSRGQVTIERTSDGERQGVRAVFSDEGPGIEDLDAAMRDGFSTGGSLGLGLPGSKRLVDELTITSKKGSGTTVSILKWRR